MIIELKTNEALSTSFDIQDVNWSANTFEMKIADSDNIVVETCTLTPSFISPDTHVTVYLSQPEVAALGVGKFRSDIKMTSTIPVDIIKDITIIITQGVT